MDTPGVKSFGVATQALPIIAPRSFVGVGPRQLSNTGQAGERQVFGFIKIADGFTPQGSFNAQYQMLPRFVNNCIR